MSADSPLIWERPERRGRGPAPAFSRMQLARAALRVADERGLGAITMRAVAAEIGSGSASLYRYVEHRADLVALMVDEAYADLDLTPIAGDWLSAMVDLALQTRQLLRDRPWLLEVLATHTPTGPRILGYLEHALGILAGSGASASARLEAVAIFSATVRGLAEEEVRSATSDHAVVRAEQGYMVRTAFDGEHPYLAQALTEVNGAEVDAVAQFERIVRRVLIGLLTEHGGETEA